MTVSELGPSEIGSRGAASAAPEDSQSIVVRPIDQLKANPGNPRRHDRRQILRLAEAIKAFGFRVPILIDEDGMIIAGHARCEAARLAGRTHLPTILVKDLSPAKIKAFVIADNRLGEHSTWDDAALARQFAEIAQIDPHLNLEFTGFEMGEIDFRIESLSGEGDGQARPR